MTNKDNKIKIKINDKYYFCNEGDSFIELCERENIEIPTLCNHPDFSKSDAVCRICIVKTKLDNDETYRFLPSCTIKVKDGQSIVTNDHEIYRIRKTILELLFVEHAGLCANCYRNLRCELQKLAIQYSIDFFRFVPKAISTDSEEALERLRDQLARRVIDIKNPSIARDSAKCIECKRCIKTCDEIQSVKALNTQKRGFCMGVGTENFSPLECTYCGQCSLHCPTGAITEKSNLGQLIKDLKDPNKIMYAQVAPSVRATLGEEFGLLPGSMVTGKVVSSLQECGFEKVFDVNTGADLTIVEEATELIERIKEPGVKNPLPLFTSCCPAWVLFVEENYPDLIPHLSTTRSPQMMLGSIIKTYYASKIKINPKNIVLVSIMPCTAKKYEANRPEYINNNLKDVDYVITTRELAHLIKSLNIPFLDLPEKEFDPPLGFGSGAAAIFGSSGGVAEAASRTAYYYLTGKSLPKLEIEEMRGLKGNKEVNIKIGKINLRIGIVFGLKNAREIAEETLKGKSKYDFIEVMACPGGCIAGGGQPFPINNKIRKLRSGALHHSDKASTIRESHKNPIIEKLYLDFLYKPKSRKAEKLLHTKHYPYKFELRKEWLKEKLY